MIGGDAAAPPRNVTSMKKSFRCALPDMRESFRRHFRFDPAYRSANLSNDRQSAILCTALGRQPSSRDADTASFGDRHTCAAMRAWASCGLGRSN